MVTTVSIKLLFPVTATTVSGNTVQHYIRRLCHTHSARCVSELWHANAQEWLVRYSNIFTICASINMIYVLLWCMQGFGWETWRNETTLKT